MPSVVMNDGTPVGTVIDPVDEADQRRPGEGEHDRQRQRPAPLGRRPHEERRHRVDVPERQVDLAGDQQHHLGDREDRDRRGELGDDAHVVRRAEGVDADPK